MLRHLLCYPGERSLESLSGRAHMTAGESARLYPAMPSSRYRSSIGSGERSRPMISVESIEDSGDAPNPIIRRVVDWIACSTDTVHQRIRDFRARADIEPQLVANRHRRTISPYSGSIGQGVTATLHSKFEGRKDDYVATRLCFCSVAKQALDEVERKIGTVPPCCRGRRVQSQSQIAPHRSLRPTRWSSSPSSRAREGRNRPAPLSEPCGALLQQGRNAG